MIRRRHGRDSGLPGGASPGVRRALPGETSENVPWPFVTEAHRPSLARDLIVGAIMGVVTFASLTLLGWGIARIGMNAGLW